MTSPAVSCLAVGGNRHPSAADWKNDFLVFGAGNNIAIWRPNSQEQNGIRQLLTGHADSVNAVVAFETSSEIVIVSGSADKTVRIWQTVARDPSIFKQAFCLAEHAASINTISVIEDKQILISGSADGVLKVWRIVDSDVKLTQSITVKPHFLIIKTALISMPGGGYALAVAGTCNFVQVYVSPSDGADLVLQATLRGHEGWVRALDFIPETTAADSDVLLASGSQDKYIRLWRIKSDLNVNDAVDGLTEARASLSNKAHRLGTKAQTFTISFEALLVGHEDWVYTVRWKREGDAGQPLLLSSSADNSLAIWHAEAASGLWVCRTRLGEISSQKGSTTATGSAGGFWIGLWQPDGQAVVSLARSGSWRRWIYQRLHDAWLPQVGISGHTREVQGLAWAKDGSYLLSTSSDQTTRMLAEWKRDNQCTWHEFARPQIHGYDLNCIDAITDDRFISGADEKLLRVFDKPKNVGQLLSKLSGLTLASKSLPEAANIPVLGLSNKAVAANGDSVDQSKDEDDGEVATTSDANVDPMQPSLEDQLARHTLWPEYEKLYGHGYEISAVATSSDGSLVATACKASSIDHAVIRLYDTEEWLEKKPPLTAHTLTVTSLAFSPDDKFILSVGRDRQWALFVRKDDSPALFEPFTANPKGHTRMILGCSWAPFTDRYIFATAGRDKTIRIWTLVDANAECVSTLSHDCSVTSVQFSTEVLSDRFLLAFGDEHGRVNIAYLDRSNLAVVKQEMILADESPTQTINAVRWRPRRSGSPENPLQLAIASDDFSVRIYTLDIA